MKKEADESADDSARIQPGILRRIPSVNFLTDDGIIEALKKSPYHSDNRHTQDRNRKTLGEYVICYQDTERLPAFKLSRKKEAAEIGKEDKNRFQNRLPCTLFSQPEGSEPFSPQKADNRNSKTGDAELNAGVQQQARKDWKLTVLL